MGFRTVDAVFQYSQTTGTARLVLLALAHRAGDKTRICWPSLARISRDAGLSKRAVEMNIRKLERLGELSVQRAGQSVATSGGPQRVNIYTLAPSKGSERPSPPSPGKAKNQPAPKVANDVPTGSERGALKGSERGAHEPVSTLNRLLRTGQYTDASPAATSLDRDSLITQAIQVTENGSSGDRKYLETVLNDWTSRYGQETALEKFDQVIARVEAKKSEGKITGSVAAYLAGALARKRDAENGRSQFQNAAKGTDYDELF